MSVRVEQLKRRPVAPGELRIDAARAWPVLDQRGGDLCAHVPPGPDNDCEGIGPGAGADLLRGDRHPDRRQLVGCALTRGAYVGGTLERRRQAPASYAVDEWLRKRA